MAQSLAGELTESMTADTALAGKTQLAIMSASVAQTEISADGTEASGAATAGKDAFAAFASLIEACSTPESAITAASIESDSAMPATDVKQPASTAPGLSGLSLFANPLRAAALATALDGGQPAGLQSAVGSQEWAEELGTRLAVMTAQGDQSGSLRLSPEHLGPLEVQIRLQDDKATVLFGAQHADTRRALEEALPRLREMFAASGLQLGDAGVSREAPRQAQAGWSPRSAGGLAGLEADVSGPVADVQRRYHLGLLDTVA
jgi:flagellar hook-length control protein FliK